jgi:hypothetical protein
MKLSLLLLAVPLITAQSSDSASEGVVQVYNKDTVIGSIDVQGTFTASESARDSAALKLSDATRFKIGDRWFDSSKQKGVSLPGACRRAAGVGQVQRAEWSTEMMR